MVRPALAASRSTQVLNYMAAHPGRPFTLSELSKSLDINPASALSVLQALTDAGYLIRHPRHKTYLLGPALVAVGHSALAQHRVIDVARSEMRVLAAESGTECVASVVVGGEIVVVATEGWPRSSSADIRVGQRLPLNPPLGRVFVAWAPEDQVDAWLGRHGRGASAGEVAHLRQALDSVRDRGYSVGLDTEPRVRLGRALEVLADSPGDERVRGSLPDLVAELRRDYELVAADPRRRYRVSSIAAPIFGESGEVVVALTLNGFEDTMTGAEVVAAADRLRAAARMVTKATHGVLPVAVRNDAPTVKKRQSRRG